jgi:hypothetical protein
MSSHSAGRRSAGFRLPAFETKLTPLPTGTITSDGMFDGYASLFGKPDLGRDLVVPGAFRDSLARRGVAGIRMLFQHDPGAPIGVWLDIREDLRGLYVRGQIATGVQRASETLALMRAGAIDGLSIGFKTVQATRDRRTGIRRLERIDLWEISIVTFPMLPDARVERVKSATGPAADRREARVIGRIHEAARLLRG